MATYTELFDLKSNAGLKNKIVVACVVAAEAIRIEDGGTTNHANRLIWAAGVFANPQGEANRMLWAILAANKDQPVASITGAADTTIQANVNATVDLFATG